MNVFEKLAGLGDFWECDSKDWTGWTADAILSEELAGVYDILSLEEPDIIYGIGCKTNRAMQHWLSWQMN